MFLFEIYLAKRLGKKVAVVNYTLDLKDKFLNEITSYVLKLADLHITREPISTQKLIHCGIPKSKIITSYDVAFAAKEERVNVNVPNNSIAIIARGDNNPNLSFWRYIIKNCNKNVFFLHSCRSHDKKVSDKLNVKRLKKDYNYPGLIYTLRQFDYVITDRFHPTIFSILAETPVIPVVSTTHKTKGMMQNLDYPFEVTRNPHIILESAKQINKNKQQYKKTVKACKNLAVNKVREDYNLDGLWSIGGNTHN